MVRSQHAHNAPCAIDIKACLFGELSQLHARVQRNDVEELEFKGDVESGQIISLAYEGPQCWIRPVCQATELIERCYKASVYRSILRSRWRSGSILVKGGLRQVVRFEVGCDLCCLLHNIGSKIQQAYLAIILGSGCTHGDGVMEGTDEIDLFSVGV
jgi:hypothetical protein